MIDSKDKARQSSLAINQWKNILDSNALLLTQEEINPYTKNTIGIQRHIRGILIPQSSVEIQEIVKVAQKYQTPLYPISCGKNWGYGSSNPVVEHSFIIDLSKMNKIKDFDSELGTITVEPGVTQQELYEFLKKEGDQFMVPTTGAGPSASILGNALERGYGLTPHSDHFAAVTSFHAVLANGDLYKPALEELGAKKVNQIFKWGIGPYLDGLFTQGNFGIVTEASLLLSHRPESISTFFFSLKSDSALEGAIQAIRQIKTELGDNTGAINLMNARRVLSMMEPFPKKEINANEIISDQSITKLMRKHKLTEWTGFGAIYGKKEITKAIRKIIIKTLKPHVKRIHFFSDKTLKIASYTRFIAPIFYKNSLQNKLDTLRSALENVSGIPNQVALPLAYWKSTKITHTKEIMDPAADQCGLIWHAPLIPLKPKDIRKHVEIVNQVCPKHNINPLITLTIFSGECCDSTIPILYNTEIAIDKMKAKACHNELLSTEGKEGYFPYRLGVDKMRDLINPQLPCWKFSQAIKRALDPHQILAPGRYIPAIEKKKSNKNQKTSITPSMILLQLKEEKNYA